MAKQSPAQFAAFLRRCFQPDTWYGLPATERALRRVECRLTPAAIWGAALRAGWADYYAPNQEYCLCSSKLPSPDGH